MKCQISYFDSIFRFCFREFKIANNKSDKICAHFHGSFEMIEKETILFGRFQERHVRDRTMFLISQYLDLKCGFEFWLVKTRKSCSGINWFELSCRQNSGKYDEQFEKIFLKFINSS